MVWFCFSSCRFSLSRFFVRLKINKEYVPAAATNIEKRWIDLYKYVRASEQPAIKAKHDMFKQHGRDITKDNDE